MGEQFSINHYRYLLLVAETGSFRLAAQRACRSQPAISLAVRDMEEKLGQPLFVRGSPVVPTRFGQSCLALARELVGHADQVSTTLGNLARSDSGFLSMASVLSAAAHWMPGLIEAYRARYPNVLLNIHDDNSEGVEKMLLHGQVELGIGSVVSDDARLSFEPLFEDAFGLVCHCTHPMASRSSLTWSDIVDLPHIGTVAHRQLQGHPEAAFLHDRPLFVANMLSLLAMLERNMGVTVLARLGLPPDRDELVFVPLRQPVITRCLGLRTLAAAVLSPAALRMKDLLPAEVARAAPHGRALGAGYFRP
ncbi:LysR family transcriptional regulator [Allopusillimonas soli]|uniref:LysR family transcriptional regulator n=1 Tax=Allopusillimonas soli TaxID=659016 RepID=A0A853FGN2_9BURK|nr:LysR family transcriptional regulator [Allopusillimonas soli]NYT37611.1 LysR family transcriptional regulator [Allopusillimonas soli]TEA74426.1 LysR family transcriptional regulator [Allopusillimonas soli]